VSLTALPLKKKKLKRYILQAPHMVWRVLSFMGESETYSIWPNKKQNDNIITNRNKYLPSTIQQHVVLELPLGK
jgi:hypothetical protein